MEALQKSVADMKKEEREEKQHVQESLRKIAVPVKKLLELQSLIKKARTTVTNVRFHDQILNSMMSKLKLI